MKEFKKFDVLIVGGSYAGLSAAMALGRSRRSVLVIDSGVPCNRQTPHSHNFLTQDGQTPSEISSIAKQQVEKYESVKFHQGLAISGAKTADGFEIITETGKRFSARKLIFATGIKDILPDIKGFSDCWGISVIHCPYCHGFEFRNQKTGIIANGERAFHLATLVNNLTDNLSILTSGKADFSEEQSMKLRKHNIEIIEKEISEIEHEAGNIQNIIYKDGSKTDFQAVYAAVPFTQHSDIPASLGCELTETGHIKVDAFQKTSVEGLFACGDNSVMMRSIASAVYSGNLAGAMVNRVLSADDF